MSMTDSVPTMKDVAREAGVSLGTVSKVINGLPVGEEYRVRVLAATEKLGYQVNSYARGLKTKRTYSVALIWPCLHHPFYAALAEEIIAELMRRSYKAVVMLTDYDCAAEQNCLTLVKQNKVDGIIALTYNPALEIGTSIPFVSIDRHYGAVPCVSSDNYGGGQIAAKRLLDLGCRKLLFLRIGSDISSEADRRGLGFESECQMRQVEYQKLILNDKDTEEPFYRYLDAHIHDGIPDFDGIFCNTDLLACRIRDYLERRGIPVPGKVQIVGYDGVQGFITKRPLCSTIVQPVEQIAKAAVDAVLERNEAAKPSLLCLPVEFVPGGTTRE